MRALAAAPTSATAARASPARALSTREVEHCSGCPRGETCPCPKALRRAKTRRPASTRRAPPSSSSSSVVDDDDDGANPADGAPPGAAAPSRRALLSAATLALAAAPPPRATAMQNGAVSEAWSALSGAPSDLTFPDDFVGTFICYSTLTAVTTPQGEDLVQDMAVIQRARGDIGKQIAYPMRFIRNGLGKVVMDRSYNVVTMAEATAKAYDVIRDVEWDVDDPNTLRAVLPGDGRSVFFRVNQRSEEYPEPDRIETSEVAQIVFEGGDRGNGLTAVTGADGFGGDRPAGGAGAFVETPDARGAPPKVKSSRTYTKWKFRPVEKAGDGPVVVASQNVYDYLTSFDRGFLESKGEPVTQYTYKLALFKANKYNLEN